MIITKGVAAGEVVTMKLTTGEEVITKLVEIADNNYTIHRPLTLVMSPQGIGLQQWLFTVDPDRNIKISKDKVLIIEPCIKEMSKQYLAGTSGLTLP